MFITDKFAFPKMTFIFFRLKKQHMICSFYIDFIQDLKLPIFSDHPALPQILCAYQWIFTLSLVIVLILKCKFFLNVFAWFTRIRLLHSFTNLVLYILSNKVSIRLKLLYDEDFLQLAKSSDRGSGCRPYQNLGGPWSRIAMYVTAAMSFFASLVKCFSTTLGCSDCVYEISIVTTKLGSNRVSKFI